MPSARRWCRAPGTPASPISSISRFPVRRRKRCCRRASSTCARLTRTSTAPRSAPSTARAARSRGGNSPISPRTNSTPSSTRCGRTKSTAGRDRPDLSSTRCCAATPSTSSTPPWTAMPRSACPTCPTSPRPRGGDMADDSNTTHEKVDAVIVGAGASGSVYAAVLAKAGKKVVVLDNGPDWQLSDLISSDIWGRRIKPAGAPVLLEGKHPFGYTSQAGWGVGGAAPHYFANFPRYLPTDFKIKSEHNRAHDWPISYDDLAPFYDKVAAKIGVSGDAKQ